MCESCCGNGLGRREFLQRSAAGMTAVGLAGAAMGAVAPSEPTPKIEKKPARVLVVFMYPPDDVVQSGKLEDTWAPFHWYTWPGNQFEPDKKRALMAEKIGQICKAAGIPAEIEPAALYTQAQVGEFIARAKHAKPDALVVVNFWNTFSAWALKIVRDAGLPAIVYHPVGSSHQLPPKPLRELAGAYYIHSIDNWDELQNALYAVRARKMLAQSRLLRISDFTDLTPTRDKHLGVEHVLAPAKEYNDLFDSIQTDDALVAEAMAFKRAALRVAEVTDAYIIDAFRAHRAVAGMRDRYGADAVTIKCLMLKDRKPCVSFSLNNSALMPCACEDQPDSAMTLMLGRWLLDRPGFMHNPDFDINRNLYYGAHCTCPTQLHGPAGPSKPYWIRPFFHQLPKTAALDVQWTPAEPVLLAKYVPHEKLLSCWTGKIIESPLSTAAGGCATRALVAIDRVDDVCSVYVGPHPVLFCGDARQARRIKIFANLYGLALKGNV
jgi:hypothetical protein